MSHNAHLLQLKAIYELSKQEGDIVIKVKPPSTHTDELYEPAKKKRKLNDNDNHNHNNDDGNDEDDDLGLENDKNGDSMELISIRASSIVLKSASPVFKSILSHDMMEKQTKEIEMIAECDKDVDNLLYFICTNQLREESNLGNILKLAHYYQIGRLFNLICDKLVNRIKIKNFVETVNIFEQYSVSRGYDKLIEFALDNCEDIRILNNFKDLPHSFKYGVLKNDNPKFVITLNLPKVLVKKTLSIQVQKKTPFWKIRSGVLQGLDKHGTSKTSNMYIDTINIDGQIIYDHETVKDVMDRTIGDITQKVINVVWKDKLSN